MYQDLSMHHDWSIKNSMVDLPIRLEGNLKHSFGNLLSFWAPQNKDISVALKTLI